MQITYVILHIIINGCNTVCKIDIIYEILSTNINLYVKYTLNTNIYIQI